MPYTRNYSCIVGAFTNIEKHIHKQSDQEQLPGSIQIFVTSKSSDIMNEQAFSFTSNSDCQCKDYQLTDEHETMLRTHKYTERRMR